MRITEQTAEKLWREYCATHTLPAGIPPNPDEVYASEWRGWADWIGSPSVQSLSATPIASEDSLT